MNRRLIFASLLAMILAACGTQGSSEADATLTPEPTPEATSAAPTPSDEPVESEDDGGGQTGSLDDLIPDDLNGVAGTPIPGLDQIFSGALAQQGLNVGEAEFAFVTYGEGTDAVILQAFKIPGVQEGILEQLAQIMSGAGPQGTDVETTTVGGKTVISFTGAQTPGVVYFYVADDVAFTVAGENADLVEQLLSELP